MSETPIDPDVLKLLDELGPEADPPLRAADLSAEELREGMRTVNEVFTRDVLQIPIYQVTDALAGGRDGDIAVRVYRPQTPTAVIVYFHGGAWVVGDIETHDLATRRISRDTGAVVISVDYRMLPEHPFPAPLDDAYDATVWARETWPDLPLLVAGDSAGGTLSAAVCLRARDEAGPRIDAQVLIYPGIDDNMSAPSMIAYRDAPRVSLDDLEFFLTSYGTTGVAVGSPYALPGRATSLSGLPPAIMVVAGHDPLRSSEEEYAERLEAAGVPVIRQLDPELIHAWIEFAERVPSADRAFSRLTSTISELINPKPA